jgi:exopolyphosphatase/guanosine-5'-triphosphate,3'-diphosphate pyrophosphatase
VAFVDIGTNTIRLLLVRINPNQSFTILNTEEEIVRLGEGEFVDQHLLAEAMRRAAVVCGTFSDMAQAYGAEEIIAIATSATREAENKKEFLRLLQQEAGLEVRTVSGLEEARLVYLGLSSGVHLKDRQGVFIDIGGGSTEVIVGDQVQYHYLDSLKLGAIRLSTLFFLPEETGSVPDERFALIQQYVRNAAVRTLQRVRQYRLDLAVGSSGTIENLADIAAWHFYGRRREPDDVLPYGQLEEVVRMLRALPLGERRKVPGINPARADIIIGGAAILLTLMQELGLEAIAISDRGLRDGLLEDYLRRSEHAPLVSGMSVRSRSVLQFGRACNFEEGHARQVTKLALQIFDGTKRAGLHNLGKMSRELLEHAAMLHDIGSFVSHTNHQAHSDYMIRNADLLGFDQREIAMIATTAFFHRKEFPRKKHPQYRRLDKEAKQIVRVLAVCLQIAESLDRSHAAVINQVRLKTIDAKKIALALHADQDCQLEIWGMRDQVRAFKRVFGRKLILEVCSET